MEVKKQAMVVQAQAAVALVVMLVLVSPVVLGCSPNGRGCKDCIVKQMKQDCPPCTPILHCMARCLWGGTSRSVCIKKCDCNNGYPTLSDCKRCMSKCKCSCVN
ncbi:TNFR/CD27/30/40/95 cysteine-rich region [Senna tora]|uniref:TNFR/CD27/30/40/95 cysteine-rich region n=1 Tax=Senna tora TaxID=362788 RepID=A0A835CIP7_9FABA|nr:TNFR/CD27/30/40/95 cysteine-rich region [Senna tora]